MALRVAQALFVSAAIVCALITTPLDVARTRLLLERADAPAGGARDGALRVQTPARLARTVASIARDEGVDALFRGAALRVLYTGVVVAALIPLRTLGYVAVRDWVILGNF